MKLCITGGGTGGHLMIAQALVEAATERGHEVIFIGSTHGQDRKYFEHHSRFSHVYFLPTTGVVNQKGFGKIKALFKIIKAFFTARMVLKMHKVDATYSVGGFSAAPASFASISKRIPLFIHEQNAVTGRLNSILRPFSTQFISAYETSSPIKGYPVKEIFIKTARIRTQLKTILFAGGSQGARAINELALSVASELDSRGIKIIHQAGENNLVDVESEYKKLGIDVELYGFTKDMPELIAKSDLCISRAGASTLWELTTNGCPGLFVPYPYAAGDHQYHNAQFIVENDLGWCQREGEGLREKLLEVIDKPLEEKSKALLDFSAQDVALTMIKNVEESVA